MKRIIAAILALILFFTAQSQTVTEMDGDWKSQFVVLKNTAEADVMIRVGDIDNLGFGWSEGFIPFSGKSTESHGFPWDVNNDDAAGTDRIFVLSSYKYGSAAPSDGYTSSTQRPDNKPVPITIPLGELKGVTIQNVWLQLFIDDFQSEGLGSKFQVKINGLRFVEAEKMISRINQTGPIGKFISLRLTDELLQKLNPDVPMTISIDDPTTGNGDGFAIDFVKLLVNPKGLIYKGNIKGRIIDEATKKPIANAVAEVKDYGTTTTDGDGNFLLNNVPAGLAIVTGSAAGYASDSKPADVIMEETTEEILLELKRSGKVTYNNKALQEGDNLVMNNIQFEVSSATLLAAGKTELDKLASLMKSNPGMEILLTGHTSSEGAAQANRELSLRRVRSCKNYLSEKGIDEGRITIRGYGPDKPVAANDTEANRAKNRRVEMKVTKL